MIIYGKNINLRTVEEKDAEFILDLRQNENKNKYLSKTSVSIESQIAWIESYKEKEKNKKEFYFVIESKSQDKLGLVRIYDLKGNSFCWGSWIIKEDAPKTTAIESALQIYEFGFYKLGFIKSHFDVRKDNHRVIVFHKRFGAKIIEETEIDVFFDYNIKDYEVIRDKYKRYL
ncbi:MAG: RimJ/RimL family protein N-acetyltransferase [Francisella sp.]|jgi:RimJ/RimL family protein N-acetyltransferase